MSRKASQLQQKIEKITDEEYTRWVFLLGEYYKGQSLSESESAS